MPIDTKAIMQAAESHAAKSGHFERINGHEPKNAPGKGLSAAVWVQRLAPVALQSGLAATSALLLLNVRVYSSMLSDPQDAIDPRVVAAVDELMNAYSGHFTLGGLVADVDLLGRHGTSLTAEAGYLTQDNKVYRVMTITVPLILNNVWEQVA